MVILISIYIYVSFYVWMPDDCQHASLYLPNDDAFLLKNGLGA